MSLGSSNMAGTALGTAFSLLLCTSIIQGLQDVEIAHDETTEAVVGQNVTLSCIVKSPSELKIVNIEWSKQKNENRENTKLVLYSHRFGFHPFWPNVTIQIENDDSNMLKGSYLHLPTVEKWDSGIYVCDIATFPFGSMMAKTELKIKDRVKIMCDVDSTVDVHSGENVTIHCGVCPNAQYRWTKNKKLVSENESLELWWVTTAHAGVYTLTVNTGNESLHKEFTITVLSATTSLMRDHATVSPGFHVTEEGLPEPADSGRTTSPTTGLSTTDTDVTWTMSPGTDVTDDNPTPSNVTITAGEHINSSTNYTHVNVTPSPAMHTDPYHLGVSSTSISYGSTGFRSTQEITSGETRNRSVPHTVPPEGMSSIRPEESSTMGNNTEKYESPGATLRLNTGRGTVAGDAVRSHLEVLTVVPILAILALIAVAGFLYRRRITKQRMALPPPFKPPPPPVKYTAARHREVSAPPFLTSRCNSETEFMVNMI